MPILGKQAALRIFGDRCSARAGSEAGRRMQRGHWRICQDGQLLGTVVCSGTGVGSAGRGALSQGSGQEQMFPVGHCRLGFPEVHMTPGTALGRDPEGWSWSAQGVQPCFLAWSAAEIPGRHGCAAPRHTPLAWKPRLSPVSTGHPSLADRRAAPSPPQPLTPPPAPPPRGHQDHQRAGERTCHCRLGSGLTLPREAGTAHKATPSPPGLLLLTSFLLHVKEDRASPTRLVCDNRLIQKYIVEAKDMEKRVDQCQALPALSCPAVLPLVDFTFQQWKSKSNETKRREILCDLALLVGAAAGAQGQVSDECGARQLSQLYRHANSFFLLLQTFSWEAGHWESSCSPYSMEQTHITSIFLTYRQLVQGKLRFFFYDLAKVLCKQGQGDSRDPPCGAQGGCTQGSTTK
ncbi:thrombopoietin isoform X2 [Cyanistes caeruleus]|uniref:thrombopoietin isoform X2 n=1 Tax=Cyanistes caeruleus TaxID=156563 RepID=UPI000CDB2602|nr:thrombopoietin isoform X2 [Cyanistes caeruleus]